MTIKYTILLKFKRTDSTKFTSSPVLNFFRALKLKYLPRETVWMGRQGYFIKCLAS